MGERRGDAKEGGGTETAPTSPAALRFQVKMRGDDSEPG